MSELKFILADTGGVDRDQLPENYSFLKKDDNIVLTTGIAECLNAERTGVEAVIWSCEDYDQLEELSPKKEKYGWMLVSINIPVYFHITHLDQLQNLNNIRVSGFYSEDLSLLKASEEWAKTLKDD